MKPALKKTFLRIVFILNICCVLLLLAMNAAPYLNPYTWWPIALAGIIFPLFLVIIFLFFIFWLVIKRRKAVFSLIAILISTPNILSTFGTSISSDFNQAKHKSDLRIVTWNTGLMNYTAPDSSTAVLNNATIFRKLKEIDADVLCLQEFFTAVVPGNHLNFIDSIAKTLNYPYHYFSFDVPKFDGNFYMGTIIFSRYAIADTQKIDYPKPFAGSIIRAGVIVPGDTIDIITTRLQSVHFQRDEYKQLSDIKSGTDTGLTGLRNIIAKLRLGYKRRVEQIRLVKELISKSNRPLIFTGDLNDIPVSYTYAQIKNNLKDAWVKKGYGLGRTFVYISPTLRIDQIFYNSHFTARQVKRILGEGASDHNALVADLTLKKE
jgi:endonuclease/exonuclease/phosphatase (EEP) superfamily protein YafD